MVSPIVFGYNVIKQPSILNRDNTLYVCGSGNPPVANFTIKNDSSVGFVEFDGSWSYDSDGIIISYDWTFDDGTISNGEYVIHQFCDIGTYDVTLTVTDNDGLKGNLTKSIDVILANIPPPNTEIDGPPSGNVGTEYEYTFRIFYTDDAILFLLVEWGDGNTTDWIGPYFGFDFVVLTHSWSEAGKYTIRAKAKDFCREGSWAEFEVTMPRDKATNNILFWRFLERFPLLERFLTLLID